MFPPIYQTVAYEFRDTAHASKLFTFSEPGFLYTRVTNPTVDVLGKRVAALDGGTAGLAVASGMAATIMYTLAENGGRILASLYLYGGSTDAFQKLFPQFGVAFDQLPHIDDAKALERDIKPDTKAIFVETVSNPTVAVADLEVLSALAHKHGIPLVVDNTFATPYLLNPIKYGADIVVYSATKALNGHGNLIADVIYRGKREVPVGQRQLPPDEGKHLRAARPHDGTGAQPPGNVIRRDVRHADTPALSELFRRDAQPIRRISCARRNQNAVRAGGKAGVERAEGYRVSGTQSARCVGQTSERQIQPVYRLGQKYLPKGAPGMLSFGFKGTVEQSETFRDALKLWSYHGNVGDARSLIVNSPKSTHSELTPEEQKLADIEPNLLRISFGLEDADDLIADLDRGFAKVSRAKGVGHAA